MDATFIQLQQTVKHRPSVDGNHWTFSHFHLNTGSAWKLLTEVQHEHVRTRRNCDCDVWLMIEIETIEGGQKRCAEL